MYELIIVWNNGERETHKYNSEHEAREAANNLHMVFGSQLWTGVNRTVWL